MSNNIQTYQLSVDWVSKRMKPFTSTDLRKWLLESKGIDCKKSISWIMQKLLSDGKIKLHAFTSQKNDFNKIAPVRVWISVNYSAKQAYNAKNDKSTLEINFDE